MDWLKHKTFLYCFWSMRYFFLPLHVIFIFEERIRRWEILWMFHFTRTFSFRLGLIDNKYRIWCCLLLFQSEWTGNPPSTIKIFHIHFHIGNLVIPQVQVESSNSSSHWSNHVLSLRIRCCYSSKTASSWSILHGCTLFRLICSKTVQI